MWWKNNNSIQFSKTNKLKTPDNIRWGTKKFELKKLIIRGTHSKLLKKKKMIHKYIPYNIYLAYQWILKQNT